MINEEKSWHIAGLSVAVKNDMQDIFYEDSIEDCGELIFHAAKNYDKVVELNNELEADKDKLIKALNDINCTIFATGGVIGMDGYFRVRELCVDTIREVGGDIANISEHKD